MLTSAAVVAFVATTDLDRARDFYSGTLGLTTQEITPYACVLIGGGTTIRATKVDEFVPQPFTVLGWEVNDIRAAVAGLVELGVAFTRYDGMKQDADGLWSTPDGSLVAWFKDPDGNTLSLT